MNMNDLMVGALGKRLERAASMKESDVGENVPFLRVAVLGDGYCFWHCILRCSLANEYKTFTRGASGGPTSKNRLVYEIDLAKTTHKEFLTLYKESPNPLKEIIDGVSSKPEVEMEWANPILQTSGICFRITLDKEVWLVETHT